MLAVRQARVARALIASLAVLAAAPALGAPPLALEEALRIAEARSPQLASQRAAAESAAALVPAAGENPDPKLIFGVENVPVQGSDRWSVTGDSMTMRRVGVMQDFVRREKRDEREARAQADADREAAVVEMQRADLRRDVASAWFERLYAERSIAAIDALIAESELQAKAAGADLASGKANAAEAVMARSARAMLIDRRLDTERQSKRAMAMLERYLGADAARPPGEAPDVEILPHHTMLEMDLERHPHLAMYGPMEAGAQADVKLAEAQKKPDFSVELSYGQRGAAFDNMVSLMVRMDLPIFQSRRQDPVVASKQKALDQVRAQAEDARRRHVAEIRAAMADWDFAKARLEEQRREIVPLAEERARLAQSGYAGARTDLAAVFEARRAALEARLGENAAQADLARAWAQLEYLVPERSTR